MSVKITFSNNHFVLVEEDDVIVSIYQQSVELEPTSSLICPNSVSKHYNNGLAPSVLDCISTSDYFVLNDDYSNIYSSKHIVRLECI